MLQLLPNLQASWQSNSFGDIRIMFRAEMPDGDIIYASVQEPEGNWGDLTHDALLHKASLIQGGQWLKNVRRGI